jgi:trigger factor
MKISLEEVSKLERRMNVELPPETVAAAFDRIYQSLQRDVEIKGFRKGKAPLNTIKSMYRERIKGDVVNELVQEHYSRALNEKDLDPISFPQIQVSELDESKPFTFTASFELRPEVKINSYEGLQVEKEILSVDDSHLDKVLQNIKDSHATREPVLENRPAVKGDILVIDFEGFNGDQPVPNTQATDFELELGSGQFIPGFEEGLEGASVGQDRSLDLEFPKEYHSKDLAGTKILFKVKIKGLKKKTLPEINDELATRVGFESVEKMKETLINDHRTSEEKRIQEELKSRLLKALVEKNPVEVPKTMLAEQKKLLVDDVRNRMKSQGLSEADLAEYEKKWDSDFDDSAKFMIQSSFLISAIGQKENLMANEADLDAKIAEYAQQTGIEPSKLKGFYKDGDNKSRLMYRLTEEKVLGLIMSKAKIKEVKKENIKS